MAVRSAVKPTWAMVEQFGLTLPDVETGTSWGAPALKVRGTMFACVPTNKAAEKNSIVVRLDFPQRDELLAAEPGVYYLKEHYVNYPCVLARLGKIHPDALRDLVSMAWTYMNAKAPRRRTPQTRKRKAR
jgi:hypothetical protein